MTDEQHTHHQSRAKVPVRLEIRVQAAAKALGREERRDVWGEKGKRRKEGRKRKGGRKQVIVTDFRVKVRRVF